MKLDLICLEIITDDRKMIKYEYNEEGSVSFQVDKGLYPLKAIYRTAYLFTDRYYIGLDQNEKVYIISLSGKDKKIVYEDVGEFQNELLNQSLNEIVNEKTRDIRKLIVTRALYSAFVPEEENEYEGMQEKTDEADYNLDEIAKAWYEE